MNHDISISLSLHMCIYIYMNINTYYVCTYIYIYISMPLPMAMNVLSTVCRYRTRYTQNTHILSNNGHRFGHQSGIYTYMYIYIYIYIYMSSGHESEICSNGGAFPVYLCSQVNAQTLHIDTHSQVSTKTDTTNKNDVVVLSTIWECLRLGALNCVQHVKNRQTQQV